MNFIQRALTSIKRNTRKSIILFVLLVALGSMMSGAILVNQATDNTKQNIINNMQPSAIIGLDYEAMFLYNDERVREQYWAWAEPLPLESVLIHQIGALPYVAHYEYFAMGYFFAPSLKGYEPVVNDRPMFQGGRDWAFGDLGARYDIRGVHRPGFLELEQGIIEIIAGRTFTEQEIDSLSTVALVSEQFAMLNQLTIGSIITLENVVFDRMKVPYFPDFSEENVVASESYDVEIIGIFGISAIDASRGIDMADLSPWDIMQYMYTFGNRIYTPGSFVERAKEFSASIVADLTVEEPDTECLVTANTQRLSLYNARTNDQMRRETFFTLQDPNYIMIFRETVQEMLPEFYTVAIAANNFDEILLAMDTLDSLATMVFSMTVGAMLLIVSLIIMLFLRDRKHEMGIYLSIGEKRSRIIMQMIVEVIVVALFAFVGALFIGNLLAGRLGEYMLLSDLLTIVDEGGGQQAFDLFFRQGLASELSMDVIASSYDLSFSLATMLLFLGIGLGTVFLATIVPVVYILRLNPKKIMM